MAAAAQSASDEVVAEDTINHTPDTIDAGKQYTDFTTKHHRHYTRHITCNYSGESEKQTTCDQKFTSASTVNGLAVKTRSNSVAASMPCPCCKDQFETATKLEKHLLVDHNIKEDFFPSSSCSQRFVSTSSCLCVCVRLFVDSLLLLFKVLVLLVCLIFMLFFFVFFSLIVDVIA